MAFDGLTIIGESINDSVPSTNALYEAGDFDGISELARFQEDGGAKYIDVNVGVRSPETMAKAVKAVLASTHVPVSIDSPDYALAEAGLRAYDPSRGKPILNSISPLRTEMFNLYSITPFRPILLLTERIDESGESVPSRTVDDVYSAALFLFEKAKERGIENDDIIFDPGVSPIGSDSEGALGRLVGALEKIHANPDMKGVHASVGLSNFTVMLPSKRKLDGSPVKSPLESALLTIAFPLGMDHIVGSVKRKYERLPEDSEALQVVRECMELGGFASIKRVRKFYR
ncbi:MAG: dihydropteroate synthase [Thermoguttaceae bacterium]|nr:dihydropteroate synthase [Thermoguttaceae bacterium]MBQ4080047.1 dihydropteroate synthase [Thermoguttaceae bacterium]